MHTQETLAGVADLEVLILELVAVDGLATSACEDAQYSVAICKGRIAPTVTASKVTTLDHEVLNDTMEGRALVAKALLASGQSAT